MPSSTPNSSKKRPRKDNDDEEEEAHERSNGMDEIDALFANKKNEAKKQQKANVSHESKQQQQQQQHSTRKCTISSRQDLVKLNEKEWVDDGLGGKFNKEGFTGRREDGVRIYKAHLLNKKEFGNSPDCPFDCDCCYI